jgi:hypothetical protein
MNTRFLLTLTSAVALAAGPLGAAESLKDRALDAKDAILDAAHGAKEKAREEWHKSKGYLSDDPETYGQSARERLSELDADITSLRQGAENLQGHPWFQMRLTALEQQFREASNELTALPPEAVRHRDERQRQRLDANLDRLEQYVALAQGEERDLLANP